MMIKVVSLAIAMIAVFAIPLNGWGHGYVGSRFVPEPGIIHAHIPHDGLHLPSYWKSPQGHDGNSEEVWSIAYQKRITERFSLAIDLPYKKSTEKSGIGNPEIETAYTLWLNPSAESVGVFTFGTTIGNVGARGVREEAWELHPGVWMGKGTGNLPESLRGLRPLFGLVSASIGVPLGGEDHPPHLEYGAHLHYSIPYLQGSVADLGIPWPLSRLHPVVEILFETPLGGHHEGDHKTEGRISPGLAWVGKYWQISVQSNIPLNDHAGGGTGWGVLFDLFLDDIAPKSWIGRPIFPEQKG